MNRISEDASDRLVELFFNVLPSMESEDVARILEYVVKIVEREMRRAAQEERDRWVMAVRKTCRN